MFKSIRWRLSILYFVLVFIAMALVGILVSDKLEDYYLNQTEENLMSISNNTVMSLLPEGELIDYRTEIQNNIEKIALPTGFNVYLVDATDFEILAASIENLVGKNAMEELDSEALMKTVVDKSVEKDQKNLTDGVNISKIYSRFIPNPSDQDRYIIYASASLTPAYQSLNATSKIIVNAGIISLMVTLVTGYLISGSITKPINDLNIKANLIARGDFSQRVEAASNDEIGTLGKTFNFLTERLSETLMEISSEKSKLDAIINNMADGLMAVNEDGFITMYNNSLLKILNIKSMDIFGNNLTQLSREIGIKISLADIKKSLEEQDEGSLVIKTKNGKTLRMSTAFYRAEDKKQKGYAMLFHDITESQKLEDMRREFVANVSHELKTPITTIKAYAETLNSGMVDDEETAKEFLGIIEKESDRMANLVKDLLELSHIDFKKTKWTLSEIQVTQLLEECMEHLKIYYKQKNQQITLDKKSEPTIIADKNKMSQVIVNILSNAIKYTPAGGNISITLSSNQKDAFISIRDNGIGIPKEDVERVFERFYRVDKGRAREMGGTGLGLAIARDTVRGMGGDIYASSQLGEGSEFTIKIPLKTTLKTENVKNP